MMPGSTKVTASRRRALFRTISAGLCLLATFGSHSLTGLGMSSAQAVEPVGTRGWLTDYAQARSESEQLGLPLIVHFSATWCGPCQTMKASTLHKPQVESLLGTRVIGLMLDFDQHADLRDQFRVERVPTDIVVAPNGRIMSRSEGGQNVAQFSGTLLKWSNQFQAEHQAALARLQTPVAPPREPLPREPRPTQTQQAPSSGTPIVNATPTQTRPSSNPLTTRSEPIDQPPGESNLLVGLDGFSPVAIHQDRRWKKGLPQHSYAWQGVLYYMSSEDELRQFTASPQKFAPQMLGCDPVTLLETSRAQQGSVQFAAFYDRTLYLFSSIDTRNRFKQKPDSYTQLKHVLRSTDVIGTRVR